MEDWRPTDLNGVEKHVPLQETTPGTINQAANIEPRPHTTYGSELDVGMGVVRRKVRRKEEGPLALCCEWVVEHQISLAVSLLLLLGLTHMTFPRARRYTRKFFELSYYNPESGDYTMGWDDACMVFYWLVLFTGLRTGIMEFVLVPFARWGGIDNKKDLTRFSEQAWLFIYCSVFWSLGTYLVYTSDYWFNLKALWTNWPNREIHGLLKWYILAQYAFWLQQIMVVNIEKRRKDYAQMFTHHVITCLLLFTSYGYHQTKVANVFLCLTDLVDVFFPLAKCLKYLKLKVWPDIFFGIFMASWVVTRHVLYLAVCYSVWHDIPIEISYGCYQGKKGSLVGPLPPPDMFMHLMEPFQNSEGLVCFTHNIKWAFLIALLSLQCIFLVWFWMVLRVAAKVLRGEAAEDTRSDDEDEQCEDDEQLLYEKLEPIEVVAIEEEVGVESINFKSRMGSARRYKKSASSASGVTLPGHSDRKELLGRIGCDKGV